MSDRDELLRREFLDNAWRRATGREERSVLTEPIRVDLDDLGRTEWSDEFEIRMRRRLIMGALRYGRLRAPGKPRYDRLKSIRSRLAAYELDGNLEWLVDVANLCLLEWVEGDHPKRHFKSIDDGEHVEVVK